MRHSADVAAIFRALSECLEGVEKDVGAEWHPKMKLGSAENEIRKVKRAERLETSIELLAILARRGRLKPLVETLQNLNAKVTLAEVLEQIREFPKQLEMFGGDFIELVHRALPEIQRVQREHSAEVHPIRRKEPAR
jgi:hypothetical protein